MISYSVGGSTARTESFLNRILHGDLYAGIEPYAQRGVEALRAVTPIDKGYTANAWYYEIEKDSRGVTIWWKNSNTISGFNVAIGLQYGHGTGTGGWVEGYDYINPALQPIFDQIAEAVWKEVQRA